VRGPRTSRSKGKRNWGNAFIEDSRRATTTKDSRGETPPKKPNPPGGGKQERRTGAVKVTDPARDNVGKDGINKTDAIFPDLAATRGKRRLERLKD